jgi:hypothetical protein
MPLDEKSRLKLDKVFMAFGSQMHALERNTGDQAWREYREEAWAWSITKVYALVDELWQTSEKAGPQSPPPPEKPVGETASITVKGLTLQSSGNTKQGRPWKLYKITDEHDTNYFTFHTSFQLGERYEVDWEWQEKGERKWRAIPTAPRPVQARIKEEAKTQEDVPIEDDEIPF